MRAFLDVQTWYLNLEVTIQAKGRSGEKLHTSTTAKAALDFSDLGPTITLDPNTAKSPYKFIAQLGNSRYWMIHAPATVEGESEAAATARDQRWLDSLLVLQSLTRARQKPATI